MSGREQNHDRNRGRGGRLAEALRENLRRRKAQARSRRDPEPEEPPDIEERQRGDEPARD